MPPLRDRRRPLLDEGDEGDEEQTLNAPGPKVQSPSSN